jgi:flavodoxin/ferredoxin
MVDKLICMLKCVLYYFSGTGNTALCAKFLKKHLSEQGYEVTLYEYKEPVTDVPDPNDYDLIGIGYPIHAFNICQPFTKFLKKLPKVNNKKLFIFKVSGEPFALNNASSAHIYRKLKRNGYKLIMEKHYLMPYNIMFSYRDTLKKQMYLYLDPLTNVMSMRLANGEEDVIKYKFRHKLLSFLLRIEWLAPKVNHFLAHSKKDKCIKCMKCINSCPTQSMYINKKGTIHIKAKCAVCMRCTLNCPTHAINFGMLNHWAINGSFNYQKLLKDDTNKGNYVNLKTTGYFRKFRKYFKTQNEIIKKYNLQLPVHYDEDEDLSKL